jgi:hypothetical protein
VKEEPRSLKLQTVKMPNKISGFGVASLMNAISSAFGGNLTLECYRRNLLADKKFLILQMDNLPHEELDCSWRICSSSTLAVRKQRRVRPGECGGWA